MRSPASLAESVRRRTRLASRRVGDPLRLALARRLDPDRGLVWVDLGDPGFNTRYTYLLLKFLLLAGHRVGVCWRPALLRRFNALKTTVRVLDEERLYLLPGPPSGVIARICDRPDAGRWLHWDYFAPPPGDPAAAATRVRVPMAMDPGQYALGTWDAPVVRAEPAHAAVWAGSVTGGRYDDDGPLELFGMKSRAAELGALRGSDLPMSGVREVPPRHGTVYLLTREAAGVEAGAWRPFLAGFRFFIALPGQVMPLCHSVVEAMSVGTVPILHHGHAALFDPPLRDGADAVVQRPGESLGATVVRALAAPPERAAALSSGARSYYASHLRPEVVARRILAPGVREVLLCGEGRSVELLRRRQAGPDRDR